VRYTDTRFTLLLTRSCSLHCAYCFATRALRGLTSDSLSLADLRRFVAFAYTSDTDHERIIFLAGGEPSLHPDFIEIVNFLLGEQFQVRVLTNGIWTRKAIEGLHNLDE